MSLFKNIKRAISHPREIGRAFMTHTAPYWKNDKMYLKYMFYFVMGQSLNLRNPKTFNEKLQWLKLYNRKPEYCDLVDKYKVKKIVASIIGEKYIIPTIGVWSRPEEIDFNSLPNRFVLKTTHDGGSMGVVICKDKSSFNFEEAIKKLNRSLNHSAYVQSREWPYKDVERKIIAEEFIEDSLDKDLHDYKVLCFEGEPKLIEFHSGRYTSGQHQEFYDTDWNLTDISQGGPYVASKISYPKPECLDEMLSITKKLCKGHHHIRVDWYILNRTEIKFGELTFFDGSGFDGFDDIKYDELLGSWIKI